MTVDSESEFPLAHRVAALLKTRSLGRSLRAKYKVNSTSTWALDWAAQGAPHGSIVLTDYQLCGRGRMGRTWEATAGQNLLFSVVLRPDMKPSRLSLITLAASLAVADALTEVAAPVPVRVKWPNDILLDGRKCCGMLLESTVGRQITVVLGIGINVNQTSFPPELESKANSLILASGRPMDRATLMADVLLRLEQRLDQLQTHEETIRRSYVQQLSGRGRVWHVGRGPQQAALKGTIQGITKQGALRLKTSSGMVTVHAGDLTCNAGGH